MLLKRLTEASGVSGNEKEVRDLIISEIKDHVDSIEIDNLGNLIAHKKGPKQSKKLMLAAHMDEVGLMVTHIDQSGLLKFIPVGGMDKRILVSKAVWVGKDKHYGVIGAKPIHLQARSEWQKPLNIEDLYIDIGASSKEDAEKYVEVGDYVAFASEYRKFGNDLVKAKALDDRVGCAIIIDLIKEIKDVEFYAVFTVMEELGLVGAGPAAYSVDPDIAIILEGTVCYDLPKLDDHLKPTQVGLGPAVSLVDRMTVYDADLRKKVENIAKDNQIAYQYRKTAMGANDSGKIHISKEGVRTAGLSVPCRNIHSPSSVMSLKDYKNTLKLTRELILAFKREEL